MHSRRLQCCFALLMLTVSSSSFARPGNPERYPVGAGATGMGGAAIADGISAWFNPAGLGEAHEHSISASMSAFGYTHDSVMEYVRFGEGSGLSGELSNDAIDVFPASFEYVLPLGKLGPLQHGLGLSFIVPDFDQFDGVLDVPSESLQLEVRARILSEDRTYWVVSGWGACYDGWFCFGAGPAVAVRVQDRVQILTLLSEFAGSRMEISRSDQSRLVVLTLGGQLGFKLRATSWLRFGLTVRSPMYAVASTGELLSVVSQADNTGVSESFVDRVETQSPQLDFQLPWRFGVGLSIEAADWVTLAADVRVFLGVDDYTVVAGPNGEGALQPETPSGPIADPSRAIEIQQRTSMKPTVNFNLGAEFRFLQDFALQVGLFSDLTATPRKNVLEYGESRLSRIGGSLSFAWATGPITTWVGLIYSGGWGEVPGLGATLFDPMEADLTSHTILLMLGSTLEI
ncbi:MAG: hypothetical protein JRJ87_19660 [Deltaproteobacteria bacterium]|nr:hypothetical protein [Deltaproteobacteria bacterium]